jgi:hypothetical protein
VEAGTRVMGFCVRTRGLSRRCHDIRGHGDDVVVGPREGVEGCCRKLERGVDLSVKWMIDGTDL